MMGCQPTPGSARAVLMFPLLWHSLQGRTDTPVMLRRVKVAMQHRSLTGLIQLCCQSMAGGSWAVFKTGPQRGAGRALPVLAPCSAPGCLTWSTALATHPEPQQFCSIVSASPEQPAKPCSGGLLDFSLPTKPFKPLQKREVLRTKNPPCFALTAFAFPGEGGTIATRCMVSVSQRTEPKGFSSGQIKVTLIPFYFSFFFFFSSWYQYIKQPCWKSEIDSRPSVLPAKKASCKDLFCIELQSGKVQ